MTTPLLQNPDVEFERLYEKYARIVYRYALALMRNPADAEDITQTTFLNAYRAMKGGERPLKPRHWLLKIAHNACRMRWVRNSRRPQEVAARGNGRAARRARAGPAERPRRAQRAGEAPFNQRSAIVMRELEGRSYEEIAETLDVTVPAVEALLVRARRSMRLRRSAINALGAVQLPASLESFFAGSAAVATGGALAGSIAFKAAAVLVAGLVAGGAGYTVVDAATKGSHPKPARAKVVQPDQTSHASGPAATGAKAPARAAGAKQKQHAGPPARPSTRAPRRSPDDRDGGRARRRPGRLARAVAPVPPRRAARAGRPGSSALQPTARRAAAAGGALGAPGPGAAATPAAAAGADHPGRPAPASPPRLP